MSGTSIQIPSELLGTPYDSDRHPQSATFQPDKGANCQLWAYAVLKHFGIEVPPFRSRELWEDRHHSEYVKEYAPLDLILFNDTNNAWGAHVAVYLGESVVAHLSRQIGLPATATIEDMLAYPKYPILVGAKRMKTAS